MIKKDNEVAVDSPSWFRPDDFVASINHLTGSPEMVGVTELGYGMMSSSTHFLSLSLSLFLSSPLRSSHSERSTCKPNKIISKLSFSVSFISRYLVGLESCRVDRTRSRDPIVSSFSPSSASF